MKNRLLNIHVIISLSNFSILLSDIPKPVSQKPYQGVLCWCGCPEYPVQERCSQGFPFAHKNTTFQTGMNGNYLQVFTVHVFINFYHLVTKRRSFTILPCRISPSVSYSPPRNSVRYWILWERASWQFLQSFGYWSVQTTRPHTASEFRDCRRFPPDFLWYHSFS